MKIKSLMASDPITITENASIQEAISLMQDNHIRHLPVVASENRLVGLVTLSELREGLIPSMVGDVQLNDLMIADPITVSPDEDIEQAALLIYQHKVGGMPVLKKNRLVGIITATDILRAFIDMMGILTASSRLDIEVGKSPDSLNRALEIIHDCGGEVISVAQAPQVTDEGIYYFRLRACETEGMEKALSDQGFKIANP